MEPLFELTHKLNRCTNLLFIFPNACFCFTLKGVVLNVNAKLPQH